MSDRTIIAVGAAHRPDQMKEAIGLYLDGDHAAPQTVALIFDDTRNTLVIHGLDGDETWPYGDIRALHDQAGADQLVLRLNSDPTARLVLTDDDAKLLLRGRAKHLSRNVSHVKRSRIAAWAVAAVGAVALIIFVLVPLMADQLAEYLPPEGEKALGDATFEQIRAALDENGFDGLRICDDAEGLAALQKIEDRLTAQMDLSTPLTVHVLDHAMINAFALPGGHIVFFRGLIDFSQTPEEVAAVFAHEIGHVAARDPTRIALRSAGSIGVLGLLFGDFAGGAMVLFLTEQIIRADYTQDAEAQADTFAYTALLDADLPPSAIATFFDRLREGRPEDAGILEHFESHPAMGDRIAAAEDATPQGRAFTPVLTPDEWAGLQNICL